MKQKICQSCGIPLAEGIFGTNSDGTKNDEYCAYCYQSGKFTLDINMNQMIEYCLQYTDQMNKENGGQLTAEQFKACMQSIFPTLNRWKQTDSRGLSEKAEHLLSLCKEVTLASVNVDGFPRPVALDKIHYLGFNEVWVVTAADSEKVADFRHNPKAGLSYSLYGDSVALRGIAEVITDNKIRKQLWQDYFINYFPEGPTDPNYVLIQFVGTEATIWINREFSRLKSLK